MIQINAFPLVNMACLMLFVTCIKAIKDMNTLLHEFKKKMLLFVDICYNITKLSCKKNTWN